MVAEDNSKCARVCLLALGQDEEQTTRGILMRIKDDNRGPVGIHNVDLLVANRRSIGVNGQDVPPT